ncbi:MAG: ribosome maturation factor RimM [Bacteroidota bacterium]
MSDFFAIGKIVKSRGLKGDLVVQPLTDRPERFKALKKVWVGIANSNPLPFQLEDTRVKGRAIHLRLQEIGTRDAADALVGKYLYVTDEDLVRLPQGTHFVHDIIGSLVIDEQGRKIGTVEEVWKLPANDVYVVRQGKREHLVPAVQSVIEKIDTQGKQIQVRMTGAFEETQE